MEEGRRKQVMIGVIIVCFAVAGYITFSGGGSSTYTEERIPEDATVWVKCVNPRCKAAYEMNQIAYTDFLNVHAAEESEPSMVCEKCGKPSVFLAHKCLNPTCDAVFFFGDAGPDKPLDACPKCEALQNELSGNAK